MQLKVYSALSCSTRSQKPIAEACMRHGYCTAELIVWYVMRQLIMPHDINEVTMQKEILTHPKVAPSTLDQGCVWLEEMQHRLNLCMKTGQVICPEQECEWLVYMSDLDACMVEALGVIDHPLWQQRVQEYNDANGRRRTAKAPSPPRKHGHGKEAILPSGPLLLQAWPIFSR